MSGRLLGRGGSRVLVTYAVAATLTACSSGDEVEVGSASAASTSRQLTLGVDSCGDELEVDVKEELEAVHVLITRRAGPGDGENACRDTVRVKLKSPLGERTVVDDSTGEQVQVGEPSD